ncbi:hypothetical protein HPB47_022829 [Ixodes persulcatus]|uniref:Uncharacterized protein n=1 Tax=Ixodes persulcatus TaxID=34615 RepID=A0AC60Q8Q1_IXOPE|nr:hypothetical protein HPB47_022829 [Ixodes persulcatus]
MDTLVVVRGKCFRSQKKTGKPYCVTSSVVADGTVEDSSCECAAKESLCNHAFALLRLVVVVKGQGYEEPSPEVSCTELPQQWRRPRGPQIAATSVDDVDWRSVREGGRSTPIGSRLYDAWKHPMDADEVQQAARDLGNNLCALGATPFAKHLRCVQVFGTGFTFGRASVGSPLSYQHPVSPHEFVTYVSPNIDLHARDASASKSPTVPQLFHSSSIFDPSTRGLADARFRILQELSLTPELASQLEKNSRQQSKSAVWKTARRNRLTASAFGNVKARQSWTTDRLRRFASDKDLSRVRAIKHGITHEPDAVTKYEKELRRLGHDIQVSCCGLFVDPASPWLGASPDRVVFHATEAVPHGVVEVKCPYTMWLAPSPDVKAFPSKSPQCKSDSKAATRLDLRTTGIDGLREIVRDIVREELRKLLPTDNQPAALSIAEVVREEVQRAFQPEAPASVAAPEEPTLTYAAVARRPAPASRQYWTPPRRDPPAPQTFQRRDGQSQLVRTEQPAPRKTDVWRTADRRPLCYHCGEADHVYRSPTRPSSPECPCAPYPTKPAHRTCRSTASGWDKLLCLRVTGDPASQCSTARAPSCRNA